jgi:hypothetical protein
VPLLSIPRPIRVRSLVLPSSSCVLAVVAGLVSIFALLRFSNAKGFNGLGAHAAIQTVGRTANGLPNIVLWAWERPEDLRFLASREEGVAFLARTIELRQLHDGDADAKSKPSSAKEMWLGPDPAVRLGIKLRPRLQPLQVTKETKLTAVVRIETTNDLWHRPAARSGEMPDRSAPTFLYTDAQREAVADMAASAARLPQVKALQIDFDASQSEQAFYAALLADVRQRLPQGMPLSITALASWCTSDPWVDRLPPGTIDEVVPMLFRLGPDAMEVASYVESGKEFRARACRGSVGLSTDERFSQAVMSGAIPQDRNWAKRRIYVFSPASWGQRQASSAIAEVMRWHKD